MINTLRDLQNSDAQLKINHIVYLFLSYCFVVYDHEFCKRLLILNYQYFFEQLKIDFFYQVYPFRRSSEKYVRLAAEFFLPATLFINLDVAAKKM